MGKLRRLIGSCAGLIICLALNTVISFKILEENYRAFKDDAFATGMFDIIGVLLVTCIFGCIWYWGLEEKYGKKENME